MNEDNAELVRSLTLPPALLILYCFLTLSLCGYLWNHDIPGGKFVSSAHLTSVVILIAAAMSSWTGMVPKSIEKRPTHFVVDCVAIYIFVGFLGFAFALMLHANLFVAFILMAIVTTIWTLIRQGKERATFDAEKLAAENAKRTVDENQERCNKLIDEMATKSAQHLIWLIELESAREAEIKALKKELLELQNTHYVSADLAEEDS